MAQETGTRDIEQDLALCEKATPGPWQARQIVSTVGPMQMLAANGWEILGMTEDGMPLADWFERKEDAVFTVEARVALPYWLGEVKRLRELTDALGDEVLGANADLAKANIALRTENERLREALDEIANPVKHMRDEAERKGARLNGLAIQLANNAAFLRNIARDALEVRNG